MHARRFALPPNTSDSYVTLIQPPRAFFCSFNYPERRRGAENVYFGRIGG